MILLLCGAFALVVAVGDRPDAAIIAAVVVLNTVIGVVQDVRAQHAIDALSRMAAPVARAWRDGSLRGSLRPTSSRATWSGWRLGTWSRPICRLVDAVAVEVDESAMTGESIPVTRTAGEELLAGTVVTRVAGAESSSGPAPKARSGRSRPWSAAGFVPRRSSVGWAPCPGSS